MADEAVGVILNRQSTQQAPEPWIATTPIRSPGSDQWSPEVLTSFVPHELRYEGQAHKSEARSRHCSEEPQYTAAIADPYSGSKVRHHGYQIVRKVPDMRSCRDWFIV